MIKLATVIVTLFNIGKFPYAPGTLGSFFSFIILSIIYQNISYIYFLILFLIILIISKIFIDIYNIKNFIHDPKEIVIDEFLGCFFIFLFIPTFKNENFYILIFISFLIFRIFDISKLFPINIVDKNVKNSFGIIFDDLIAAMYTIITLKIIYEFIL